MLIAAKILIGMTIDLLTEPELLARAKHEFATTRAGDGPTLATAPTRWGSF